MASTSVLAPNQQLRWAVEALPNPQSTSAAEVTVGAPSLTRDESEVPVAFRRATFELGGRTVPGWVFEGAVLVDSDDRNVEAGFPGLVPWLQGKLGPYCLDVQITAQRGDVVDVRIFATTRQELDRHPLAP